MRTRTLGPILRVSPVLVVPWLVLLSCDPPPPEVPPQPPAAAPGPLAGMVPEPENGHYARIHCYGFSADGLKLYTGGADNQLLRRGLVSGTVEDTVMLPFSFSSCAMISGERMVVANGAEVLAVGMGDGTTTQILALPAPDQITVVASDSNCLLLVGTVEGRVLERDVCAGVDHPPRTLGAAIQTVGYFSEGVPFAATKTAVFRLDDQRSLIDGVTWTSRFTGNRVVVQREGGLTSVELQRQIQLPKAIPPQTYAVSVSKQGVVAAGSNGGVHIYAPDGEELCTLPTESAFDSLMWSPDGSKLVAGTLTGEFYVEEMSDCKKARQNGGNARARAYTTGRSTITTIVLDGDAVVLGDAAGRVSRWIRDDQDGWRLATSDRIGLGSVTAVDKTPRGWVATEAAGTMSVSDATSSHIIMTSRGIDSFAVRGDKIHASVFGNIYAYDFTTGAVTEFWRGPADSTLYLDPKAGGATISTEAALWQTDFAGAPAITLPPFKSMWLTDSAVVGMLGADGMMRIQAPAATLASPTIQRVWRRPGHVVVTASRIWITEENSVYSFTRTGNAVGQWSEPVPISTLHVSPDNLQVVTGLIDGRAMVRDKDGELRATLVPIRDGGGYSVGDQDAGQWIVGEQARAQIWRTPDKSRRLSLREIFPADLEAPKVVAQPDGSYLVTADVFSSSRPSLKVDDRIEIQTIQPIEDGNMWRARFYLMPSDRAHHLRFETPAGISAISFVTPPLSRAAGTKHVSPLFDAALLIGISEYERYAALAGVKADVETVSKYLKSDMGAANEGGCGGTQGSYLRE